MLFQQAVPSGPAISAESGYTGLALGDLAPAGRPHVVCNFVSSADGKATAKGRTALLGGEGDRRVFHLLRTQVDAVLAGTGTLAVENYGVLVRDPALAEIRAAEGRSPQPLAVVVSRSGRVPFEIPLFADPRTRAAVYLPPEAELTECPAELIRHDLPAEPEQLAGVLRSLRTEHDVRALLCEGGPALFNSMLAADLVDELFLTLAPAVVGGQELGITTGGELADLLPLRLIRALEHEGNLFLRYRRCR